MSSHWTALVRPEELLLNVTQRFNCPSCGGLRTFSITKTPQGVKYRCFKASCDIKGIDRVNFSAAELREIITGTTSSFKPFHIPEHWVAANNHEATIRYLKNNNSWKAYRDGRADIRYDPKQDRHVFVVRHAGNGYGAAGRSLSSKPKWYVYGNPVVPFIAQTTGLPGDNSRNQKAFVVEDCASACAVSSIGDGIALLGTNLSDTYIGELAKYEELVIALDKDASNKAIAYQKRLSFYTKTKIKLLDVDLKYLNHEQLQELMYAKTHI